jgi:hypothetical protein
MWWSRARAYVWAVDGTLVGQAWETDQPHGAMIEARMHAVAVELDFVQPLIAFRRRIDKPGELRPDPLRQKGRVGARRRVTGRAMPGGGYWAGA